MKTIDIRFVFVLLFLVSVLPVMPLEVSHLRVQNLLNPQGVDSSSPLFSWQLHSDERGVEQSAYKVVLTSDIAGSSIVWESGKVLSSSSVGVKLKNLTLQPSTRYFWHVTIWDNKGNEATSTETAYFDTGLMSSAPNPLSPAIWIKAGSNTSEIGTVTRYVIEWDMYLVNGSASIIFGGTSTGNYNMWQINCKDYDQPAVRRHVYVGGSSTTTNSIVTQFSKSDLLGHLRHYKVDVRGGIVRTYIDDTLVDTYSKSSGIVPMGFIGMRVHGSTEEAYYDNIRITAYNASGIGIVTLNEDFEGSSYVFPDCMIEEKGGSHMCYMASTSGEKKIVQSDSQGMPRFRKSFEVEKAVREAKLYTSGLGIYDLFINGQRVGHVQPDGTTLFEELKPGWSDYRYRVFYSSHDVTTLLAKGANVIGAVVSNGWWSGSITRGFYGDDLSMGFIAKLLITYEDGTKETFVSDLTWQSSLEGALRRGDIYDGEIYDARREADWVTASYDASHWRAVEENMACKAAIMSFTGGYVLQLTDKAQPVRKATIYSGTKNTGTDYGELNAVQTTTTGRFSLTKGQGVVIDFGQNVVGWVRFRVRGTSGTQLHVRFAEMLNDNGSISRGNDGPGGSLYLAALRDAKAELYYTLAGKADGEEYCPHHTFYGFRYCEIVPTDDVEVLHVEAQPISSSTEDVGMISTSDARVNQLVSNIQWSQRGNLLSVPTDCPQRNERHGWTGDAQAFCQTAMYKANTESFFRKWLQDMRDGQHTNGGYHSKAPDLDSRVGAAGWSDAGIIVPWKGYLMYGDVEILEECFASMERYMNWLSTQKDGSYKYAGAGTAYADWLSFVETDKKYVSVAYYAYDALLMAKICWALDSHYPGTYATKAAKYEALFQSIRDEFDTRYLKNFSQTSQTSYILALAFDLLKTETMISDFKNRLAKAISDNDYKLNTGFLGTSVFNPTLSKLGMTDYAYDLLLQRGCPSWLYSVDQGATTTWERWNSYTRESGFGSASMNSFNHYAYGAVGEWMYQYMAGIAPDEAKPGFKHIILQPQHDCRITIPPGQQRMTKASATFNSRYGTIVSAWAAPTRLKLTYDCTVPPNTTATLRFPARKKDLLVLESGVPAAEAEGVTYVGYENGVMVYELVSGTYHFSTDGTTALEKHEAPALQGRGEVYDLGGRMQVAAGENSDDKLSRLPHGIYVSDGRKMLVK